MQRTLVVLLLSLAFCTASLSQDCLNALQDLEPVAQEILRDIEARDWESLLQDVAASRQDISAAVQQCLGRQITLHAFDSSSCEDALLALLPDLQEAYEAVEQRDWAQLVQVLSSALPAIEHAFRECGLGEISPLMADKCVEAIDELEPIIPILVENVSKRNWDNVKNLILDYENRIDNSSRYCDLDESDHFGRLGLSSKCQKEIKALVPTLEILLKSSKNYNLSEFKQLALRWKTSLMLATLLALNSKKSKFSQKRFFYILKSENFLEKPKRIQLQSL